MQSTSKQESILKTRKAYVSEDNWLIFKNTHEAIIDRETFYNVQRIRENVKGVLTVGANITH
ncbi:recombinase family protein [Filifactor alocis]